MNTQLLTIVISYGKTGKEGEFWAEEVSRASTQQVRFIPFNHREVLEGKGYDTADRLDQDYRACSPHLQRLQSRLEALLKESEAQCLFVTNDNVYHPDFLLKLPVYRALYTTDDPGSTYTRTIPYLHAFDHVFHCALPYSPEKNLREKLLECGARNVNFLPLGAFNFEFNPNRDEEAVFSQVRDIDFIYIGSPFFHKKFDGFLTLVKAFGPKLRLCGFWRAKHSIYLSIHARGLHWVRPVSHEMRVKLYQRSKIGFNLHWDRYGLGNQRLYHLPANGVMQVCDSTQYLGDIFQLGQEIVPAESFDEMVEKGRYFIENEKERERIARGGYRRVMKEYRIAQVLQRAAETIRASMSDSFRGSFRCK